MRKGANADMGRAGAWTVDLVTVSFFWGKLITMYSYINLVTVSLRFFTQQVNNFSLLGDLSTVSN